MSASCVIFRSFHFSVQWLCNVFQLLLLFLKIEFLDFFWTILFDKFFGLLLFNFLILWTFQSEVSYRNSFDLVFLTLHIFTNFEIKGQYISDSNLSQKIIFFCISALASKISHFKK